MLWDATAWCRHQAIFEPLNHSLNYFQKFQVWPTLEDYQCFLKGKPAIYTASQKKLKPISLCDDINYEVSIYQCGEIEMRQASWHDFFNLMVWSVFPKTKAMINALQVREMEKGYRGYRSSLQNRLTHLDESGLLILSCDETIFMGIKNHEWRELFLSQREKLITQSQFFLIGHGKYEQALNPFIGLTAKAVFINVEPSFFDLNYVEKLAYADEALAQQLEEKLQCKLAPLPILGIPAWHVDNNNASFYDNKQYFRDKPKRGV